MPFKHWDFWTVETDKQKVYTYAIVPKCHHSFTISNEALFKIEN